MSAQLSAVVPRKAGARDVTPLSCARCGWSWGSMFPAIVRVRRYLPNPDGSVRPDDYEVEGHLCVGCLASELGVSA